jgi:hypothetical protein
MRQARDDVTLVYTKNPPASRADKPNNFNCRSAFKHSYPSGQGEATKKRVGICLRVSTTNGQTTENQRRKLEAVAGRSGWDVVEIFEDKGRR